MKSIIKNPMKWLTISLVVISFQTMIMAEGDNDKVGSSAFKFLNIQTDAHGAALGGLAAHENEYYILATDLINSIITEKYEIIDTFSGSQLFTSVCFIAKKDPYCADTN